MENKIVQNPYQVYFYVPSSHLERVKNALFAAGAGTIGNYSHCCWQIKGTGQYKPNNNASPFLGKKENICCEEEYKVEIICLEQNLKKVISALKKNHPFEEPAFGIIKLEPFKD